MDQTKTGALIRELRKEKALTQEQLAEKFGVSRRTVSRWETGSNMPDLDILVLLSDFFEVDLRELLDGERKEKMDKELEETVKKVAEYSNNEKERQSKVMLGYFIAGLISLLINMTMEILEISGGFWSGFLKGMTLGLALCTMVFGILYITGNLNKICQAKRRLIGKGE